jgi:hypothetical protein
MPRSALRLSRMPLQPSSPVRSPFDPFNEVTDLSLTVDAEHCRDFSPMKDHTSYVWGDGRDRDQVDPLNEARIHAKVGSMVAFVFEELSER